MVLRAELSNLHRPKAKCYEDNYYVSVVTNTAFIILDVLSYPRASDKFGPTNLELPTLFIGTREDCRSGKCPVSFRDMGRAALRIERVNDALLDKLPVDVVDDVIVPDVVTEYLIVASALPQLKKQGICYWQGEGHYPLIYKHNFIMHLAPLNFWSNIRVYSSGSKGELGKRCPRTQSF